MPYPVIDVPVVLKPGFSTRAVAELDEQRTVMEGKLNENSNLLNIKRKHTVFGGTPLSLIDGDRTNTTAIHAMSSISMTLLQPNREYRLLVCVTGIPLFNQKEMEGDGVEVTYTVYPRELFVKAK